MSCLFTDTYTSECGKEEIRASLLQGIALYVQLNLLLKLILHVLAFPQSQGGVGMEKTRWFHHPTSHQSVMICCLEFFIFKALKLPNSTVEQNKGSIKVSAEFACWLCPECQLSGKLQACFIYVQKLGLDLETNYQITRHGEVKRVIGNN